MQKGAIKLRAKEVEYCLQHFPETRNSDITLLIKILQTYHAKYIFTNDQGKESVTLESLYDLPREDGVKRIRANFNSKGKYLPTSEAVARGRMMNIEQWRAWLKEEGIEPESLPEPKPEKVAPEKCPHGLPLFVSCPNCNS